ncbi:MAG: histidine kinase [Erysipelotrichia bacterium]|nr:histidine kinase [Erysipelotrichia bacterium]
MHYLQSERYTKQAEQAIIEFTEFLRGNMDSLTADKPVSFEQELEHTRHYLTLE